MWSRCSLFMFSAVTYAWVSDPHCITADGSAGQCRSPSECPSFQRGNTVPCRYSSGFTMRVCCPQTQSYTSQARGNPYVNDQPLVFPTEFEYTSQYNAFQRPTMGYINPFSLNQNSNYPPDRPINPIHRPTFDDRPLIGNQPMFSYETTKRPFRPDFVEKPGYNRPTFNERPDDRPIISKPAYSERPSFSDTGTGDGFFNTRPDFDERPRPNRPNNTRPIYNERPNFESGLVITQSNNRPDYNERPGYNQKPDYNERPNQNERPDYNERPNQNERPVYNERPSYNERPDYNEKPFNQRPDYERPDLTSSSHRPKPSTTSHSPGGYQKPGLSRPNSEEGSSWGRPTTKKTTPRPTWSVNSDGDGESTSSRKRISEQKCEEYSRPVLETINVLPLSIDSEAVPLKVQKCEFSAIKLIVGGEASELGEFPHMAAVGFRPPRRGEMQWNCGGTLISDRYILTAAHCVNTTFGNPVTVRLGEYNLARDNDGAEPVDYGIDKIIVHPNYVKTKKYNDIALIRLSRNVQFNKWIRPACLPTSGKVRGDPTATGWGRTDFVGKLSDILMKVNLNMIDNQQCNSFYRNGPGTSSFSNGITDTMLCAGVLEGGRDTCLGDSGGPLTVTKKDNPCIHSVIGITSFGKVCGARNSPGVYTKVHKYLSWIERTVWSSS